MSASYTMLIPFLPMYLINELGVTSDNVNMWSGIIFSVTFIVSAVMAPIWGKLSDKKGRKPMAVRAGVGLAITYFICGILALFGMIIRNSIILIDQIKKHMLDGEKPWNAIIDSAVLRFRPIMLTAAAAILGMMPLVPSTLWGSMAIAISCGLVVATILTLLILPTMYAAWFKITPDSENKLKQK